ncbi:hypothetical protein [Pontibacillus marinus]|uniref:Uncharacterized protein n=1 Tax=Pontibacillus marinus BH030004 = DSM 16465 TaxID=1385511 RepID=A0A0A5GBZ7_9BACI|nr:hypothetical protein [Pontibacillus marinus]KGX88728.1 hypothetical protein N783_07365 [Pontibacillus marinus BH030004 = DSM 16465]
MKRFLFYFGWTILIGVIMYQNGYQLYRLRMHMNVEYERLPYVIGVTLFPILLGLAMKIPGSWLTRKETKWGFDWIKFLAVGIPTAYIALLWVWTHLQIEEYLPFITTKWYYYSTYQRLAGIVFGYILLDSLRVPKD